MNGRYCFVSLFIVRGRTHETIARAGTYSMVSRPADLIQCASLLGNKLSDWTFIYKEHKINHAGKVTAKPVTANKTIQNDAFTLDRHM